MHANAIVNITTVRQLAELDAKEQAGYVSGAVLSSLQVGDTLKVGQRTYTVTRRTAPRSRSYEERPGIHEAGQYSAITVSLKSDLGKIMTFELWDDWVQGGEQLAPILVGKGQTKRSDPVGQLSRDIEGEIILDLINEYNLFHTPSQCYQIIQRMLNAN